MKKRSHPRRHRTGRHRCGRARRGGPAEEAGPARAGMGREGLRRGPADRRPHRAGRQGRPPTAWTGKATVSGARVVHREGYRFRDGDKLTEPDGWQASSHRPIRVPPATARRRPRPRASPGRRRPAPRRRQGRRRADRRADGARSRGKAKVALKDVLAGKPVTILDGSAVVRLVTTATPVATGQTEDDFPAACYGPDGTLWVAYIGYHVRDDDRRIEQKPLKEQPENFKALYTPEFGDQLFVKSTSDGKWSEPIAVTEAKQDMVRCAIAADGNGAIVVAYSANRDGRYDVYARPVRPKLGKERNLTGGRRREDADGAICAGRCVPASAATSCVAVQSWHKEGSGGISLLHDGDGVPGQRLDGPVVGQPAERRQPVAHGHRRRAGRPVAHRLRSLSPTATMTSHCRPAAGGASKGGGDDEPGGQFLPLRGPPVALPTTPRAGSGSPTRKGPEQWGKDFGASSPTRASRSTAPLGARRLPAGRQAHSGPPPSCRRRTPEAAPRRPKRRQARPELRAATRYAYPQLGIDGKGRVWLTYRQKFGTRYTHPPRLLLADLRPPPRRRPLDRADRGAPLRRPARHRPVLLPHAAAACSSSTTPTAATPRRRRSTTTSTLSYLDLPGDPVEPKLVPHDPGKKDAKLVAKATAETRGGPAHPRLPHRGRRQEVPAAARRIPPPHRNLLGRRAGRLAGGHVPLRHRRGRDGLDRQRRPRQRRRPRIHLVADAEDHRRLPRPGPLHADVHLRAQRRLPARPPQLHVRPARRPHPAAAGRARTSRSRRPASTPTTPRCCTAT